MAKVRERHGTDAATYLGFNTAVTSQLKFSDNVPGWYGCKYIGEWCAQTDKPNGRGILIRSNGYIWIGQWKDGYNAAGPIIFINSSGTFQVGEKYADAKGALRDRWTTYNADGTKI